MSISAGKLRHRITIQRCVISQDSAGNIGSTWEDVAEVWAAVEPLSAREFIAAQATLSKVVARITIRYRDDVRADMRIVHGGDIYNIEGVLLDNDSGREYITLPVSTATFSGAAYDGAGSPIASVDWSEITNKPIEFPPEAHTHAHGALTDLGDDDHTQYLLATGARAITGTQTTRALLPSSDAAYNLGSAAARYGVGYLSEAEFIAGAASTVNRTTGGTIIATATQLNGGAVTLTATPSVGYASSIIGSAIANGAGAAATMSATLPGASVFGSASANAGRTATISSAATGALVAGYALGSAGNARMSAEGSGSVIIGFANSSTMETLSGNFGGTIFGYATLGATMQTSGWGSSVMGAAFGAQMKATANGARVGGLAFYEDIVASAAGSFAFGDSTNGQITATAANAVQFGPGDNAEPDTFKIGSAGLRIKGTAGAPGTPVNGDIYMGGTGDAFVTVRSNGKAVQLNVGQSYTTNTYTTDRNLTSSASVALSEVADVLATLISDLKAAGHLN